MPSSIQLRKVTLYLLLPALLCFAFAALVAHRNYSAAHTLLEADPPSPLLLYPQRTGVAGLRAVAFTSRDKLTLSGWYVPSRNGAAVVVTTGTNSDRTRMLPELRVLADAGFGVLVFDWPGLGQSAGAINWGSQARNALTAAIDWLSVQPDVDPGRIGGLGFSIGGFVMTQVTASDQRLRAIVLEAAPPSFDDYIQLHFTHWGKLSEWSARCAFRGSGLLDTAHAPAKLIFAISPRPLLILVGSLDSEVAAALAGKLYAAARDPKFFWLVEGASHGGYVEAAGAEFSRRVTGFFAQGLKKPTQGL